MCFVAAPRNTTQNAINVERFYWPYGSYISQKITLTPTFLLSQAMKTGGVNVAEGVIVASYTGTNDMEVYECQKR